MTYSLSPLKDQRKIQIFDDMLFHIEAKQKQRRTVNLAKMPFKPHSVEVTLVLLSKSTHINKESKS